MHSGDAGSLATPRSASRRKSAAGPNPTPPPHPNRGRRLFLIGAAATALGGGGVAAAITMRNEDDVPTHLTMATGPKGAVYVEVGGDIARAVQARSPATRVDVRTTAATVENLNLLSGGVADIGFASLDAAAVNSQIRKGIVTALTRVYDSCLHLVVLAESWIHSMRDLNGSRVSIGGAGSGTEFTANRLLAIAEVSTAQRLRLGQTPSMKALEAGTIDAAFSLTGFPTPAIADLANRRSLRFVPLGEYFGDLDRAIPRAYAPAPIPSGAYRGVGSTDTVLVPNVLMARPELPDAAVTLVLEAMFAEESRRFWVHPESQRFGLDLATMTGAVTLHPAARSWLKKHRGS